MFDYAWQDRDEYQAEYTHDTDDEMVKTESGFRWLWLLLIPLFVFVGWAARDYTSPANRNKLGTTLQYGVGGGPETPCVSPNVSPFTSPIQTPDVSPSPESENEGL